MISHVNIGTNDLEKAEVFYNELLALYNGKQVMKNERSLFYSLGENSAKLAINLPFDGQPATAGNGGMLALTADSTALVDQLHAKALALGGSCEGKPGTREGFGIYATYFRDLGKNKIGVFCIQR